jgi:hypothetical protein
MSRALIWLHEETLRLNHPVFSAAPKDSKAVFIWDDAYLRKLDYSLKRLVFIYETLCEMQLEILSGDIVNVIKEIAPSCLYIPATNKPHILSIIEDLKSAAKIELVADENFVSISKPVEFSRFFKYWKSAQKSAFSLNGRS